MKKQGELISYEPLTGILVLKVGKLSTECIEALEGMRERVIEVSLSIHRQKRSLDANGYLWILCTKLAEVLNSSKDEIYEEELQKYGYLDEETVITVKSEVDMSRIEGHWRLIKDNGKFKAYIRVRGSSEYNSKEMAHFLDMIILDAKEQGIETDTPEQIEEYKRLYEQRYGKLCEHKENV